MEDLRADWLPDSFSRSPAWRILRAEYRLKSRLRSHARCRRDNPRVRVVRVDARGPKKPFYAIRNNHCSAHQIVYGMNAEINASCWAARSSRLRGKTSKSRSA